MKKVSLLFMALVCITFAKAQKSNLIMFSEQGEKFSLILNGILQNEKPETNVKVTDLVAPSYKLKIIFEDSFRTIYFNEPGVEATYCVKRNNKGEYVARYQNEVPIAQAPAPPAGQKVIVYSTVAPAPTPTTVVSTTQTTTTTTAGNAPPPQGNASMGMGIQVNDPELGVNMNFNIGGANMTGSSSSTSYSSTTTTTTSSSSSTPPPPPPPPAPVSYLPGYSGAIGCPIPMSPNDFEALKSTISSKTFEDSKLTIAKQSISSNCLMASQVREIVKLFTFEDNKLAFAKYAYAYTYDIGNYFKINDAFTFESSIFRV